MPNKPPNTSPAKSFFPFPSKQVQEKDQYSAKTNLKNISTSRKPQKPQTSQQDHHDLISKFPGKKSLQNIFASKKIQPFVPQSVRLRAQSSNDKSRKRTGPVLSIGYFE